MNTAAEESLARWVAEKVGDDVAVESRIYSKYNSYAEYLNCKNVAGRLMTWAEVDKRWAGADMSASSMWIALDRCRKEAWDDAPAAIEALAKACGWEPPENKKN